MEENAPYHIVLGICAMDCKARSKGMQRLIDGLITSGQIEIIIFGEYAILHEPIERWARVNCLIAFWSEGFPLDKAIAYCELLQPFCVNDLPAQKLLLDRRLVHARLQALSVPLPRFVVLQRDRSPRSRWCQDDEGIEVDGLRLEKPFVEKPVNADDHNNAVYYSVARQGGGCRQLFRKQGDECSRFVPLVCRVRDDGGSYVYEEFLEPDQMADLKVYVAHTLVYAEERQSPVAADRVRRLPDGRELRRPVPLTDDEKQLCIRVAHGFGQTICGVDLLRVGGRLYVIDVNGWSFVKGKSADTFYKLVAEELYKLMQNHVAAKRHDAAELSSNRSRSAHSC